MSFLRARPSVVIYALISAYLIAIAWGSHSLTTLALVASSLVMFAVTWHSAARLLGGGAALKFIAIALSAGWFAEQMGSTHGWFFGEYDYTEVLGPRLGEVPVVIPMMWFTLCYAGYVIANLIVWRTPVDASPSWGNFVLLSFIAAMIVTAFDLGADPYLVFVLKAWIMRKTDGAWFGETVQGFFGWMFVSFFIVACFRLATRATAWPPMTPSLRRHALVPMGLYACGMVFQMVLGHPVEIRTIAFFAMGMPLACALAGWLHGRFATAAEVQASSTATPAQIAAFPAPVLHALGQLLRGIRFAGDFQRHQVRALR